jgi:hypothetical protein
MIRASPIARGICFHIISMFPCVRMKAILPTLALVFALVVQLHAQTTVNGITTQQYPGYTGSVTFTVPNEAGYTKVSELDGVVISATSGYTESRAGYHELRVTATPTGGGAPQTRLIQFIVRDPARAGSTSDTGLASWTPREAVDAPAEVLDTTNVLFVAPARMPAGAEFPLVVRLTDGAGKIARINGTALVSGPGGAAAAFRLYRGAGAGKWTTPTTAGSLVLTLKLGSRTFQHTVQIVASPTVQTLTGTVSGTQTFGPNAFVNVTGAVTVPAGATLRFEAGCIVRVAPDLTFSVPGTVVVTGTTANPVLFTQLNAGQAWGGFYFRNGASVATLTGAIFTGAGADQNWISDQGLDAHKPQQPVLAFDAGTSGTCIANVTDCYIVDNPLGQAAHGRRAQVTFTRVLMQRTRAGGQYNGGSAKLLHSHIVEIPAADYIFADDDNDGFYLTGGAHEVRSSVIGWCKDDGVDAGSGSAGPVTVDDSWFDSCFHEGQAWSEDRLPTVSNSVSINNGQGIEAGWSNGGSTLNRPDVQATNLLVVGNLVGARFGDNYDWDYFGKLNVQNSLLLNNGRDVWGFEWDSWTYRLASMTIQNNKLTAPLALHPNNTVFNPTADAAQVAAFLHQPALRRGFGIAGRALQNPRASYGGEVGVHLDRPATSAISLPWRIVADEASAATGTLDFVAGEVFKAIPLPALSGGAASADWVAVIFDDTTNAIATAARAIHFIDVPAPPPATTLVPFGATWKYLANGTNQGTNWRNPGFLDGSWPSGLAELGYGGGTVAVPTGEGDEATIVPFIDADPVASGIQKNATTYFRGTFNVADVTKIASLNLTLRYDDGGIVYINGTRVAATTGMPIDPAYNYYLGGTAPPDNSTLTASFTPTALVNGPNTIAVEIHQQASDSSDISFNLRLIAQPTVPAGTIFHTTSTLGGQINLLWTTSGVIPQSSIDLINWQNRPDLTSPLTITPSGDREFFRLMLP